MFLPMYEMTGSRRSGGGREGGREGEGEQDSCAAHGSWKEVRPRERAREGEKEEGREERTYP